MAKKVRYRVKRRTFVNGSLHDPARSDGPMYVEADEGLEGAALELVKGRGGDPVPTGKGKEPEQKPAEPVPTGNPNGGQG